MSQENFHQLSNLVYSIRTLRCWHVGCGGAAGPTFSLALGERVPRAVPLMNPAEPESFRQFEGEANLYVWCSWRLDDPDRPLTSSDDTTPSIEQGLTQLLESTVTAVQLAPPAWDLRIHFSNGLRLQLFCDHVPGDPSFDGNWDLQVRDKAVSVGPGEHYCIEAKTT
jgi:hypothetical protein